MTNIALVVLDTLRKDSFDEHFEWLPGTRFENAWSTSHWTVPAHASLFTGKYASEAGVYSGAESLDYPGTVLPESFSDAGFGTRAFSANVNISKKFDWHRGFDRFEGSWRLRALDENVFDWDEFITNNRGRGPERYFSALRQCVLGDCDTIPSLKRGALMKMRDLGIGDETRDDGATRALELVREWEFGDEEFLFVNLMEAHSPYAPPEEYRDVEPPEVDSLEATYRSEDVDFEHIRRAYDGSVRYLSDMYRRIFDELRADFDVVITLGDHGELLGEHDACGHLYGIYPELTHVPLSVWTGEDETTVRADGVSLLDVHATVLEAGGLDSKASRGRDLREELADTDWLTEYHGISDRHFQSLINKGITDIDELKRELSGFARGKHYFYETFDGYDGAMPPYDDPTDRLATLLTDRRRRDVEEDGEIDDAVLAQLEDLGYA